MNKEVAWFLKALKYYVERSPGIKKSQPEAVEHLDKLLKMEDKS